VSGKGLPSDDSGGFRPTGLVTLLTDFGVRDPFVGLMKAQVYGRLPGARIVDLTHDLPPYRPAVAAFWLERARHWCPPGTVHVAVVDPGVGTARRLLAAEVGGQAFLGPDNGLLGAVLAEDSARVWAIDPAGLGRFGLDTPSATFHGRDILAPLAAELAAGRVTAADLGPVVTDWRPSAIPTPRPAADGLEGEILLVDRYGNAFTNVSADELGTQAGAVLEVAGRRLPIVRTYGDAPPGTAVALANSFGVLEIAVVTGDAASELGLRTGDPVRLVSA
jgi:S-adenosyl-L-methionine hydrolase (adenosine-forming)